ncbi:Protein disulfide-isomerase LQY1 [Apostasia shenzhenica]|uniref:Protein disulfide-isomerase LQY1 n=1 Tax=Apostasia shenzhenica TaxID=1088818 RepID=A0A2H9ZRG0_9ASPA|nr:Protein disulfide-isomerase LQY1 [Apostasia shenzhenica]
MWCQFVFPEIRKNRGLCFTVYTIQNSRSELCAVMAIAPSLPGFHSSFLSYQLPKLRLPSSPHNLFRIGQRTSPSCLRIRALELDQSTIVAISVGVFSVAIGIGIPVFYETQIDNAAKRDNTQPCFPCNGSGAQQCRFCTGKGTVSVVLGGGETEVSKCINCEGAGTLTCTTCQGSGIQPRFLDRREFKDDD